MSLFVDVHTHLTHEKFNSDLPEVIDRAQRAGLGSIVVNGIEPRSNRQILQMAKDYPLIKAALGIYPLNAVCHLLPEDFTLPIEIFDIQEEIAFIEEQARRKALVAIGECGLDGHWLEKSTFSEQEKVFENLIDIANRYNIPVIVHSRKLEKRALEILVSMKAQRANLHCFEGKLSLAKEAAEKHNFYFSIPTNASRHHGFQKMLSQLPLTSILTETDAPYLSPKRNHRNEPANVLETVALLAKLRQISPEEAKQHVWNNYLTLFN